MKCSNCGKEMSGSMAQTCDACNLILCENCAVQNSGICPNCKFDLSFFS